MIGRLPLAALLVASLVLPTGGAQLAQVAGLDDAVTLPIALPSASAADTLGLDQPGPRAPHADAPPQAGDDYRIRFSCPASTNETVDNLDLLCPKYIADEDDIMAQPRLMVDPKEPNLIAFNSLHGGRGLHLPTDEAPSNRSRDNSVHQPHTTFQSTDGFASFEDNRYYSPLGDSTSNGPEPAPGIVPPIPPQIPPSAPQAQQKEIFGEDNAAILDGQGRIYLASLYASRDSTAKPYDYTIALWKAQRINYRVDYANNLKELTASAPGNKIDSVHLVLEPVSNRVAVVWRESVPASALGNLGPSGLSSWIGMAYTVPGEGARWTKLADAQRIGPCSNISNPLADGGQIYVGCFAAPGYKASPDPRVGQLYMHTIDPKDWSTHVVGPTPIHRGNAVLASRGGDGRMFLASGGLADGKPFAEVAYGEKGAAWSDVADYGAYLTNHSRGTAITEARIQTAGFVRTSGNVLLVYLERHTVDPSGPEGVAAREIYKSLGAVRAFGDWQGKVDLRVGDPASRLNFAATTQGIGEDAFDDLHDDLVVWHGADGRERTFLAYGDYGYIRYAEIKEENFVPVAFPLAQGIPPVPSPTPGVNPAVLGAAAGILSGLMAARLTLVKKKRSVEAPTL